MRINYLIHKLFIQIPADYSQNFSFDLLFLNINSIIEEEIWILEKIPKSWLKVWEQVKFQMEIDFVGYKLNQWRGKIKFEKLKSFSAG